MVSVDENPKKSRIHFLRVFINRVANRKKYGVDHELKNRLIRKRADPRLMFLFIMILNYKEEHNSNDGFWITLYFCS